MGKQSKRRGKPSSRGGGGRRPQGGGDTRLGMNLPDNLENFYGGSNYYTDEVGRMFCAPHQKDFCHICCCDHRPSNRIMEEQAGLRKPPTPVEEAAKYFAVAVNALKGMERMHPRPSEEVFAQNRRYKEKYESELQAFAQQGEDVESAIRKAMDEQESSNIEMEAMAQAFSRLNPGQREFQIGGAESQKIYDEFVKGPSVKKSRADVYSCSYCGKTSAQKLSACGRCKKESYCGRECQAAAWPAHKKECVLVSKEPKEQYLTWEQVEAFRGAPADGTLQVKAIKDESVMRQVLQCKDRAGISRRIAAYTDSRDIPGFTVGATLKWKKPRFHYFMDGSCGARVEQEDLANIVVT